LGQLEKVVASGLALLSPRVIETGVFAQGGHASAPDWLAAVSGSSAGAAKSRLASAERAAVVPALSNALHEGQLSAPQLGLVAGASAADPAAVGTLLELVERQVSHQEMAEEANRLKAAARSKECERARRQRVHEERHLRWYQHPEGGIRGGFSCDEIEWARIAARLEAATRARVKAAGADGVDSFAAHRMDALIDLLSGGGADAGDGPGAGGPGGSARPEVLVLLDAEALFRGTTVSGEICEIEGIGPVPVGGALELLGQGSLRFLIKEGKDIRSVTRASRDLARATARALLARDRTCVWPGCGHIYGLQADHHDDYSTGGPTELANLERLCVPHHDLKTYGGWQIDYQEGEWRVTAPAEPPSAGTIARRRRVAAARAAGKAAAKAAGKAADVAAGKKDLNTPQRT
jgi:hypothetical protein